ncbi:MAG: hypothetical protein LBS90_07785, partial [Oscillospiraceae bacterium]|nr:hypothetical protein [Oscillospiraceae bacterium]
MPEYPASGCGAECGGLIAGRSVGGVEYACGAERTGDASADAGRALSDCCADNGLIAGFAADSGAGLAVCGSGRTSGFAVGGEISLKILA